MQNNRILSSLGLAQKAGCIASGESVSYTHLGIATAYAKEGANLVLTGRNVKKLEDAKEELERLYGIKVLPVQADVSAGADNEAIVQNVVKQTRCV